MKRILLLLLVGASLTCPVLAQDNDSTPPPPPRGGPGGPGGFRGGNLTPAERDQLKKDYDAALKNNPDFATQQKDLRDKMMALQKQINAAMVAADPSVAPILAKMHSDGPGRGKHKDGDSSSDTSSGSN